MQRFNQKMTKKFRASFDKSALQKVERSFSNSEDEFCQMQVPGSCCENVASSPSRNSPSGNLIKRNISKLVQAPERLFLLYELRDV